MVTLGAYLLYKYNRIVLVKVVGTQIIYAHKSQSHITRRSEYGVWSMSSQIIGISPRYLIYLGYLRLYCVGDNFGPTPSCVRISGTSNDLNWK
jgi:hypothetical protein